MQVEVYLHFPRTKSAGRNVYSIRHRGVVILYTSCLILRECRFLVSQAGRERVLREQRKNVHAMVKGELVSLSAKGGVTYLSNLEGLFRDFTTVRYNPYRTEHFMGRSGPIHYADIALFTRNGVMAGNVLKREV